MKTFSTASETIQGDKRLQYLSALKSHCLLSLSLMGLFLTGCLFPEIKPCYGLEVGDELLIEIGEPHRAPSDRDPWTPVTCPDFGVEPGAILSAQVENLVGGYSCSAGAGGLEILDGLHLELERAVDGDALFEGNYKYFDERTDCKGEVRMFITLQLSESETLMPGSRYEGIASFFFTGGAGVWKCFPGCEGWFRAQVSLK